jgi:hypothetical protein
MRLRPLLGPAAIILGAVLILLLHVLPPTDQISPMWRTISEYGLASDKWVFDLAVGLVALGSAVIFGTLHQRLRLGALVFGVLWVVGLLVIIAVPKGHGGDGTVHRLVSLVAFTCLPVAVILGRTTFRTGSFARLLTLWLGITSLVWFVPIIAGVVLMGYTGHPFWQVVPLGLVERLMALNEIAAVCVLGSFRSELSPDGNVLTAFGGEGRAVPVGPAGLAGHSGQAGHQVEFGGPDVAEWD